MAKNTTLRRIMREAAELASSPSADYHAAPLEDDMYEWHFTLRGPPEPSPYAKGEFHGRISLPVSYPLKPPSFRFLTPSGRFEVNREICLSISGHHEETWQPAWGIRTALVAIRSFMDTAADGQSGGMEASDEIRKRFAGQSAAWRCPVCAKSNSQILAEQAQAVEEAGGAAQPTDTVPEELRLAYRDDLDKTGSKKPEPAVTASPAIEVQLPAPAPAPERSSLAPPRQRLSRAVTPADRTPGSNTAQALHRQRQEAVRAQQDAAPAWVDRAIYGVVVLLLILVLRKFA